MGWLLFLILALLVLLPMLWPARLGRGGLMLVGSALFAAAAGYAWQGSPSLAGAPAGGATVRSKGDALFDSERLRFLSRFGQTGQILATAESFQKLGLEEAAAGLLANSVAQKPRDADLRIGYAHALFVRADGNYTPAVALAFDRAIEVAPGNPAPLYFRGLTRLETGDTKGAEEDWRALVAALPADSPWRKPMAPRLAMFDALRAADAARSGQKVN